MAASAELPAELDEGRRAIEDLNQEVVSVGPWQPSARPGLGAWQLELVLRPKDLGTAVPIPPATHWFVFADEAYPRGRIQLFPAKVGGIEDTFPHQEVNTPGDADVPWRTGMLCLVHTIAGHDLAAARYDPVTPYERLAWHVWRTLEWLRGASRGELIKRGEPFELPVFGRRNADGPIVAFREGADSVRAWGAVRERGGLAEFAVILDGATRRLLAVRAFQDGAGRQLVRVPWGRHIAEAADTQLGAWFRFDAMPLEPHWRAPATWQELNAHARREGFDALEIVSAAAGRIRDGRTHLVLVGFPIPATMGAEPCEHTWEAFELPALTRQRAKAAFNGFRPAKGQLMADRVIGPLAHGATLDWVRSENWHPDHLAARGQLGPELRDLKTVVLGAGALGSVLAETLVRAGVTDLTVVDGDVLGAGNLSRHTLSMCEIDAPKASAVAARLNLLGPNATVRGIDSRFPRLDSADLEHVAAAGLVIDTTGSDAAIAGLSEAAGREEATLMSLSLSYGAQRLYAFTARGPRFPVEEFRAAIEPWATADRRNPDEFPWEGVGCWSSVFPARHDHIVQLAATAVGQLEEAMRNAGGAPRLVVWQRTTDGGIRAVCDPVAT